MFINQFFSKDFLEAFIKFWDHLIISSRAYGDRVLLFSTLFKIHGSRGLGRRKMHLSALLKESGRSFKIMQLPDVSEFGIVLGLVNPLLLAFGLVGRHSAEITMRRYRNRRMNKYLVYITTVLIEHLIAGRISRFWTLSTLLIRRSTVYMVFCSWKIDKNLYRNLSLRSIKSVFGEVNKLRSTFSFKMDFKRTYIPKGESHRPLGVPTLPWRIYLNMLLHPLVLAHPLPSWQHGFKPGAGTLTAWVSLFKEVFTSPNIFEGDLRQCFPSINLLRLAVELFKQGMPANVLGLYHQLNMVSPQFKGAILLNENQFLIRNQYQALLDADPSRVPLNFDKPIFNCTTEWLERSILAHSDEALGIHGEVLLNFMNSCKDQPQFEVIEEGLMHIFTEFEAGTPIEEFVHYADWLKWIGTAQGSPLSPYLAAIALMPVVRELPQGVKALFYADDFILYGPGLTSETVSLCKAIFAKYGFTIHEDKSRFVKLNGNYVQNSLKFLGLSFDFIANKLTAATRKGSTLLFNKEGLVDYEYDMNFALSRTPEQLFELSRNFFAFSKKAKGLGSSVA
jgi:hypothetical protein